MSEATKYSPSPTIHVSGQSGRGQSVDDGRCGLGGDLGGRRCRVRERWSDRPVRAAARSGGGQAGGEHDEEAAAVHGRNVGASPDPLGQVAGDAPEHLEASPGVC